MLLRHRPAPPLAAFVDSLWLAERGALGHTRERSLPTGCADIVIPLLQDSIVRHDGADDSRPLNFRGGVVQGAHDRFGVRGMGGPSAVIGVHFKPGGAAAFFAGALPSLRNRTVLLDELWGAAARTLRARLQATPSPAGRLRLLEAALVARLDGAWRGDPMARQALHALHEQPATASIEAVRRSCGAAPAQFIRRFEAAVGLTPKRYARVLRFNRALAAIVQGTPHDWATFAVDAGYFDQSHLIHEFKRLSGSTPTAYRPLSAEQPTHVPLPDR
jgi:methylphosphotriester-DNA--protein-cysteine methyltransferase